jgi:hypothetical protein
MSAITMPLSLGADIIRRPASYRSVRRNVQRWGQNRARNANEPRNVETIEIPQTLISGQIEMPLA